MDIFTKVLLIIVALIHIYFLTQQMLSWDKNREKFDNYTDGKLAKVLAGNQGLYNGFLAAGMLWGYFLPTYSLEIWTFFLGFIAIAGIYGSVSLSLGGDNPSEPRQVRPLAFLVQTIPAAIALICLWIFRF
jgi:putative membrane protein